MNYDAFIFDMDGTLADTSPGVFAGLKITFDALGIPIPGDEVMRKFIGPPLISSFKREYDMDDAQAYRAAGVFRSFYGERGMFMCELYPGMRELLFRLKNAGARLTVATLKLESSARHIVEHLGLSGVFDAVIGADPGGIRTKKDTVLFGLAEAGCVSPDRALLIGDSEYDAVGARQAGVDFCAAMYGFGFDDPSLVDKNPCAYRIYSPMELWDIMECQDSAVRAGTTL